MGFEKFRPSIQGRLLPCVMFTLLAASCWADGPPPASDGSPDRAVASRRESLRERIDPRRLVRTAARNYREKRFFAVDLTEHPTVRGALRRSLQPIDLRANLRGALATRLHPLKLFNGWWAPMSLLAQRRLADGQLPSVHELGKALDPWVFGSSLVGGLVGDVAGASVQSMFARGGRVLSIVGLVARPLIGQAFYLLGLEAGLGLREDPSPRRALSRALSALRPLRDLGNLAGYTAGMILGQALIPIPVIGGLIGGSVMGTLGMFLGNLLARSGPGESLDGRLRSALGSAAAGVRGDGASQGLRTAGVTLVTSRSTIPPDPTIRQSGEELGVDDIALTE